MSSDFAYTTEDVNENRKLATIQEVREIIPIPGADRIELARVMGWQCIVQKGIHKQGSRGVFIEVDSLVPDHTEFEFMRSRHFKVTMARFMKQYRSEGLFLPLNAVQQVINDSNEGVQPDVVEMPIGTDLTSLMHIVKYESVQTKKGTNHAIQENNFARGKFPSYIPKTEELRAQSFMGLFDALQGKMVVSTLKIHGTSATYYGLERVEEAYVCDPIDGGMKSAELEKDSSLQQGLIVSTTELHCASRNLDTKPPELHNDARTVIRIDEANIYWRMAMKYNLPTVIMHNPGIIIQGEIAGPGVNDNYLGLPELDLFVFNVLRYDGNLGGNATYLDYGEAMKFCNAWGLKLVPVVKAWGVFDFTLEQTLELADSLRYKDFAAQLGYPVLNTDKLAEGMVLRPMKEEFHMLGHAGRLSVKVLSREFEMKYKK